MMKTSTMFEGALVVLSLALASPTLAAVVNVDIERPGDATHSGADGAASTAGSVWNSVLFDTEKDMLLDENGSGTTVAVRPLSSFFGPPSAFLNAAATNDLQDSGVSGSGLDILNLLPGSTYTLVVYGAPGSDFNVSNGGGFTGGPCTGFGATFALPGVQGEDYCLYTGLAPFQVEPGVYGIEISGLNVSVTGFQLVGDVETVSVPDTTPPVCSTVEQSPDPGFVLGMVEDTESGMSSIQVMSSENVSVSIAAFDPGTLDPVAVEVMRLDEYQDGFVELECLDMAGNMGACRFEVYASSEPPPPPPPPADCAGLLAAFDEAVEAGTIHGQGPGNSANGRQKAFRNMLRGLCDLLAEEDTEDACRLMKGIYKKCDGDSKQPDFVGGEGVAAFEALMMDLYETAGCNQRPVQARLSRKSETALPAVPMTWGRVKAMYTND